MSIENRKNEHIKIVLNKNPVFKNKLSGFQEVELEYLCLPELNRDEINLTTELFGKKLSAPIMVSGMTGGTRKALKINKNIALACQKLGLPMGLGSQRPMLEKPELSETFKVRSVAPDILLAGNIGVAQLHEYSVQEIRNALKTVECNVLAVHMNAAQEAIQPEGQVNFKGLTKKISILAKKLGLPVYVKEVGHGVSGTMARKLSDTGIKAIDVQGAGGTSWVGIESYRGNRELGNVFWDFGIPTIPSLLQCKKNFKGKIFVSGGLRTGLDVVKGIVLGASIGVIAGPIIKSEAKGGAKQVEIHLKKIVSEIKTAMFLVGAKNIRQLSKKKYYLSNNTKKWLE